MRLSLDTHVFLWLLSAPNRLERDVQDAIADRANTVFVSAVVAWEMLIKAAVGKLRLEAGAASWLPAELRRRDLAPLPVQLEHVLALEHLPPRHRDPFDRLLVAQAALEGLTIVTHDRALRDYDVPTMWT